MSQTDTENFVQEVAEVVSQERASSRYFHLQLRSPEVARRARPGQFVMLSCLAETDAGTDPLLPRPLAILDANPDTDQFGLLYFIAGRGTERLNRAAGAPSTNGRPSFRVIGPLGNGFDAIEGVDAHICVGGGSGVAPLVFFFRRMMGSSETSRYLVLAARSSDQLARRELVDVQGVHLVEATDDGTAGFKGNAVEALRDLLDGPMRGIRAGIYAAGPEPMMVGAAKLARERGLPCRVSLEERMACGVGVCRACVVDGVTRHPKTGLKRRCVCQDGPVFDPDELDGFLSSGAT